jgi:hypothetical protein
VLPCRSRALAQAVDLETMRDLDEPGQPGDCRVLLELNPSGRVYAIDLSLGNGSDDVLPAAPEPAPDDEGDEEGQDDEQSQSEEDENEDAGEGALTDAEREYLEGLDGRLQALLDSEARFVTTLSSSAPDDEVIQEELAFWREVYEEVRDEEPPERLADLHAEAVAALALMDEAATILEDVMAGNGGEEEINRAFDLLDESLSLRSELRDRIATLLEE